MKTFKTRRILKRENVALSSLHLSGYWIELKEFKEFIEEQNVIEKLHVRGRFRSMRYQDRFRPLFTEHLIRTDFDLILSKIIKIDAFTVL